MARIKLLNDRDSLATRAKPKLKLYKGTPKIYRGNRPCAGLDYETFFRLECSDRRARQLIIETYSSVDEQKEYAERDEAIIAKAKNAKLQEPRSGNSVYLTELRILLAYKDLDKSFSSSFARRSTKQDELSGVLFRCNGDRIYQRCEIYDDPFKGKFKRLVDCDEPCASHSPFEPCPSGCQKEGVLKFWISELAQIENYDICSLSLHSYSDLIQIPDYLDKVAETRGSAVIDTTMYDYAHRICYVLSRQEIDIKRPMVTAGKRTGKNRDSTTWAVTLGIDEEWQQLNRARSREQLILQAGYQVPTKLLAQAHDLDIVDATVIHETPALPATPTLALSDWAMSEEKIGELRSRWRENNWSEMGLKCLLQDRYGLDMKGLRQLSKNEFESLFEELASQEVKARYC